MDASRNAVITIQSGIRNMWKFTPRREGEYQRKTGAGREEGKTLLEARRERGARRLETEQGEQVRDNRRDERVE